MFEPLGRPETHHNDFVLFDQNNELYMELSQRSEKLLEDAFKKHMGNLYGLEPKSTLSELKDYYKEQEYRVKRLREMKAPAEIIAYTEHKMVTIHNKIQTRDYGSFSDKLYKKHRQAYETKLAEWEQSDILESLLNEIYDYNELKFDEWMKEQKHKN